MNFDPSLPNPQNLQPRSGDPGIISMAEALIVRMIVMGSGGPENAEITEQGLRFVRHLMANSRACRSGFIPNFKNINCVREVAKDFIRQCGSASRALQTMYQVI
jgi:hypothetical protein